MKSGLGKTGPREFDLSELASKGFDFAELGTAELGLAELALAALVFLLEVALLVMFGFCAVRLLIVITSELGNFHLEILTTRFKGSKFIKRSAGRGKQNGISNPR